MLSFFLSWINETTLTLTALLLLDPNLAQLWPAVNYVYTLTAKHGEARLTYEQ